MHRFHCFVIYQSLEFHVGVGQHAELKVSQHFYCAMKFADNEDPYIHDVETYCI